MDITQIVTLSLIIVFAIILAILGFQMFFVLKDLRRTMTRLNRLFDDADDLVGQIKKPIEQAGQMVTAMTAGAGLAHLVKKLKGDDDARKK